MTKYSPDELQALKAIYDEQGEAAMEPDEMRALRRAGLLKHDLPPIPKPAEPEPESADGTLESPQQAAENHSEPEPRTEPEPEKEPETAGRPIGATAYVLQTLRELWADHQPVHVQEIADKVGKAKGTVAYHLQRLEACGLVGRFPYDPRGYMPLDKDGNAPFIEPDAGNMARRVLVHCRQLEETGENYTAQSVAEALGLSAKTVGNRISELRQKGLLKTTTANRQPKPKTKTTTKAKTAIKKEKPMTQTTTDNVKPQDMGEALNHVFESLTDALSLAFRTNDKVAYGFISGIMADNKLMDMKANYSKDAK